MTIILKKFEELTVSELYEVLRLRAEVFCVEQDCVYQDLDGKDQVAVHVLMYEEGELLAYCRIFDKGIKYEDASIGRVVSYKKVRGTGATLQMLEVAINYVEEVLKEDKIRISSQVYIKRFYEKLGFETVSGVYLEDGIDHVEMLRISK